MGPTKILFSSKKSGEPLASNFFPNFGARGSPGFFNKKSVKNFGLSHIMSFFVALCRGQFLGPRVFFSKFWICFFERIFFSRSHIMSTIDKRTLFSRRIIGAVPPTFPTKTSPKIARFAALGGENLRVFLGQRVVAFGGWRAPLGGHSDGHGYY